MIEIKTRICADLPKVWICYLNHFLWRKPYREHIIVSFITIRVVKSAGVVLHCSLCTETVCWRMCDNSRNFKLWEGFKIVVSRYILIPHELRYSFFYSLRLYFTCVRSETYQKEWMCEFVSEIIRIL